MTFSPAAVRLIVLLAMGFFLSGCSPITENELDEQKNPHFVEGKSRSNALNFKGAIESFEKALEANPRSASAHLELGLLYEQKMNDYAAAIYHLERHLKLRPNSHVAESVRQRIMSCKLELAKTVSFALVNQKVQAAMDRLNAENSSLRQQVEELKAELAKAQSMPANHATSVRLAPAVSPSVTNQGQSPSSANRSPTSGQPPALAKAPVETPRPASTGKTHLVQKNETMASISRRYGISLPALQAANPRVDPRRLRAGQMLNIPAKN